MTENTKYLILASTIVAGFGVLLFSLPALSHNPNRLDLNKWYESLHRPGVPSCCNLKDCHRTEAELQDGKWRARLGHPRSGTLSEIIENGEWTLDSWRVIPDEIIVRDDKGHPIANPEGEAIICHEMSWDQKAQTFTTVSRPESVVVFCFVPNNES